MTKRPTLPPAPPSAAAAELRRRIEKNRSTSLARLFHRLARASIAATVVAAAGCGSSHDPPVGPMDAGGTDARPPIVSDAGTDAGRDARVATDAGEETDARMPPIDASLPPPQGPECDGGAWKPTSGLDPAVTYDYLAAYQADFFGGSAFLMDEQGTACSGAADMTACQAEVDVSLTIGSNHLTTTGGDTVGRYVTPVEVAGFLGPINTPQEALVMAWNAGYDVYCGVPERVSVRELEDGYEVYATRMTADCDPIEITRYKLHVAADGTVTVLDSEVIESTPGVCVGRRPDGLRAAAAPSATDPTGDFFARVAHLEASAVFAFEHLARELEALGAPEALVRSAREAADDEVRHAEQMGAIARRHGAEVQPAEVDPQPLRGLFELALDNAVEGCVRETFGALVGTHQALAARDPQIAAAMRDVAGDETRHAALSWQIAEWAEPRLSEDERERIVRAQTEAIHTLRAEMRVAPDPELVRTAGLPAPAQAVALVDQLAAQLWS